jgi:hypothetical protein
MLGAGAFKALITIRTFNRPSALGPPHLGLRQVARIVPGNDPPARRPERIELGALNLDDVTGASGLASRSLCPVTQQYLGETLGAGLGSVARIKIHSTSLAVVFLPAARYMQSVP